MDACGKCGGDNSSCADCAGVPDGLNEYDLCGVCRLPTDAQFNKGCGLQLGSPTPSIIFYGEQVEITVPVTITEGFDGVSCKFNR